MHTWIEVVDASLRTSATAFTTRIGSADEPSPLGLTHLLEHCVMACEVREDASLAAAVGRQGGLVSATTGRDSLSISAHVAPSDLAPTCDLILDAMQATVKPHVVDTERAAVLHELDALASDARKQFEMRLNAIVFPGSFGWSPGGSRQAVRAVEAGAVEHWRRHVAQSGVIVVTASPAPLHDTMMDRLASLSGEVGDGLPTEPLVPMPKIASSVPPPDSPYIGMGVSLPALNVADAAALRVLTTAVGQTPVSVGLKRMRASGTAYFFDAWDVGYRNGMSWRYVARPGNEARARSRAREQMLISLESIARGHHGAATADAVRYAVAKTSIRWESTRALVEVVATRGATGSVTGWSPSAWLDALSVISEADVAQMASRILSAAEWLNDEQS